MNNNSKLHYFLESEVMIDYPETGKYYPLVISNNTVSITGGITLDQVYKQGLLPYLYPLSCLTETIIHDGKEEIPLVELAKIEGNYDMEEYEFEVNENYICMKYFDSEEILTHFNYLPKINSFKLSQEWNDWHECIVGSQLALFEYIFSRRINLFPEGMKSIDPRTLGDCNPYLTLNN